MKNNKSLIALLLVAMIGVVGLTIAYFSNTASIENEFNTNSYGTTVEEVFTSPDNWTPGTTTPKTLTVTNSGSVDEAVRVSYIESWTSANSNTEGDLSLTQNGNRAAIIHFTNDDDWTLSNGYYYYNYKLGPGQTTSELLDSVTFNPAITNDDDCQSSNNGLTVTCTSTGNGYDGATYKLTFTIETVQYDKYNEAWNLNNSVTIAESKPEPQYTVQEFLSEKTNEAGKRYNDNDADKSQMFVFYHESSSSTETRYIGSEPKNYVKFNCDDDGNNCEIWRIIGVFSVERPNPEDYTQTITEERIKLVRGQDFPEKMMWDDDTDGVLSNDWTDENTSLKNFLNDDYFFNSGNALIQGYGLKESAQAMIEDTKFYLGADNLNYSTEDIYAWERGNIYCSTCEMEENELTWLGKVALMYPSDVYMVYGNGVNQTCYTDTNGCVGTNAQTGWIYNSNIVSGTTPTNTWLLSPLSTSLYFAFQSMNSGFLTGADVNVLNGVRPVVYLKSDIKITGGTGEAGNPYILSE